MEGGLNNMDKRTGSTAAEALAFIAENPQLAEHPRVQALAEKGFVDIKGEEIEDPVALLTSFLDSLNTEEASPEEQEELIKNAMGVHSALEDNHV